MSAVADDSDLSLDSVFTEPPRPPTPEPIIATYSREAKHVAPKRDDLEDWANIEIRLVGSHPLWGHYLWNAARAFASYLDMNVDLYHGRSVLELGAGGGLPGIVAAKNGAQQVVLTDYPDTDLIRNMEYNVAKNISVANRNRISVQGYIWGRPITPLLDALPSLYNPYVGFDLIILSDLIFNHSQHDALLETCELSLAPVQRPLPLEETTVLASPADPKQTTTQFDWTPSVLVFYTHHRPHLAHRDMEFFTKARQRGWKCDEIITRKFPPMFPDDPGEEEVRSTVHGWTLTRQLRQYN